MKSYGTGAQNHPTGSLSLRRAWIEITPCVPPPHLSSSLSLRRAWIEISRVQSAFFRKSRSPYGERGLKYRRAYPATDWSCRSPYGERGLKCIFGCRIIVIARSLSLRRAWIEMGTPVWYHPWRMSLSLRRAWIEIARHRPSVGAHGVALLTESVD